MKKIGLIVSVVLLMISLSACGGFIRSEVEVFHQLGQTSRPVRFAFLPLTDQENSLEYKTYADLVSQQLRKYQYTHITNEEPADGQFPDVWHRLAIMDTKLYPNAVIPFAWYCLS
jgi:hypothetical protein